MDGLGYAACLSCFFATSLRQTKRMEYMAVSATAAKMARPGRWVPICSWNQKTSGNGVEGDGLVFINGGNFEYVDVENDFETGVTIVDGIELTVK